MRGADSLENQMSGVAQIGEEANVALVGPQQKSHRVIGIVRHAETIHGEVADIETRARSKKAEIQRYLQLPDNRVAGQTIAINRDVQSRCQADQALNVIGMFVGNQDAAGVSRGAPDAQQSLPDLTAAQPGIDEQTSLTCL